ncbi:glucose-6-phosphate dehydrogenase [Pontivivens insulae]|uniref:Glucose-6-phosphate 1-dehydrogenase n=1 Tax=Pontivivens insulae TaxID=1639689 RepID=A0A2R8A732_9RHOB|nr:glucose-6-phosphate dehydrogenase [Pontivivens insulae]RED17941.1 glucose-6-phosphate 1-dehydrogenase [Pontivivens insulae]SPF27830.1 Glucose-6-phosphate 1-dehydrogenase [Pontivivens insulae]
MVSRVIPVEPFDLVIFGGTGDLARRKILPGLYRRMLAGQMPTEARIIGAARSKLSHKAFREMIAEALDTFIGAEKLDPEMAKTFLSRLHYMHVDAMGEDGWDDLGALLDKDANPVRAFYLSVGPSLFGPIAEKLYNTGIATSSSRIVVEKPLGHDLASAKALNAQLAESFDERQVYRIDHYLGKETVQNLMAVRFANALFEPLWNARHVDHVQITVSESIGTGGRGAYYDKSGAMRDMVQNHLMQLLCLTAMEPPGRFEADRVRDEKLKVIRALEPVQPDEAVRGQYRAGPEGPDYKTDAENPDSRTESYVALKVHIANWRWTGTPFYLRTGKRLRARMSEIAVIFKEPPHAIFPKLPAHQSNALVIRLQPDEGITMRMTIKEPGPGGMRLADVPLDMTFADALGPDAGDMPDAYERLIMDVIRGDQTLFMRGDEVEAAWEWTDAILDDWQERRDVPKPYDAGGSGPEDALALMHHDGRRWREIEV